MRPLVSENPQVESRGTDVLRIMMAALGASETVGMSNVYVQPRTTTPKITKVSEETVKMPEDRQFLTHGFISRFNTRREDVLLLSLFGEG